MPAGSPTPVSSGMGLVSWSFPGPYPAVYPKGTPVVLDTGARAWQSR